MRNEKSVAEKRKYRVVNSDKARQITEVWLSELDLQNAISMGLPEVDDRYHIWRVPLINADSKTRVSEVVIDAFTTLIDSEKSTSKLVLEARLLRRAENSSKPQRRKKSVYKVSNLRNTIAHGDSENILQELPAKSVDLIFTSPPYFNARPEYKDYLDYQDYLQKMRRVIRECHRVLNEGRFFAINISPVLIRRAKRSEASKRIAVPFDIHRLFVEEGYDFIDDIIWEKPEGAGWATGRGRRFAADRNPLQYKPVPVTEYILVYRKQTNHLIDWNIRSYPDQEIVSQSKVKDGYERTNIWKITPAHDKKHPAIFPRELAERVIKYYSFIDDVVLDPFAGIGTTGHAAIVQNRRFVLIDQEISYIDEIRARTKLWLGAKASEVLCINCPSIDGRGMLF